ncbi:hypothetical protein [Janibacter melonis]|uniref:hypothetical protein n=1 Tax=Janibacter melonis TaxID=262209 RepID=UPI002095BF0F|nr:hypothetical protein [Janibacter melonis]
MRTEVSSRSSSPASRSAVAIAVETAFIASGRSRTTSTTPSSWRSSRMRGVVALVMEHF